MDGVVDPGSTEFDFTLGVSDPATVSLTIDGKYLKNVTITDAQGQQHRFATTQNMALDAINKNDVFQLTLGVSGDTDNPLNKPGTHPFILSVETADGRTAERSGEIVTDVIEYEAAPVAHTFVDGVDVADGHLVVSGQDVNIPGIGLSLQFSRTYSSAGDSAAGPLGAGWTDNYNMFLEQQSDSDITVVGGDGSGDAFSDPQHDAALAAMYGLNASKALFFEPSPGYHDVLVQADPNVAEYDLYTKDGLDYHFKLAGSEAGQPNHGEAGDGGSEFQLRYIQDTNGNRISLFYSQSDTNTNGNAQGLSSALLSKVDDDFDTLDLVTDSSGRALIFSYQKIAGDQRIVKITGYDDQGTGLNGLEVDYDYDQNTGDLVKVTRVDNTQGSASSVQQYSYSQDGALHNLLSYTDPNGNVTTYTYYPAADQVQNIAPANSVAAAFASYLKVPGNERVHEVSQQDGAPGDDGDVSRFTRFDVDTSTGIDVITDADGNATTYKYDSETGAVEEITDALGGTTTFTWTEADSGDIRLTDQVDALGQAVHYDYDDQGNIIQQTVTSPGLDDLVTTYTYTTKFNEVASIKDALGNETEYTYDDNGNLLTKTDTLGNTVTNHYDAHGQVTSATDANGGTASLQLRRLRRSHRDQGCRRRYHHLHL